MYILTSVRSFRLLPYVMPCNRFLMHLKAVLISKSVFIYSWWRTIHVFIYLWWRILHGYVQLATPFAKLYNTVQWFLPTNRWRWQRQVPWHRDSAAMSDDRIKRYEKIDFLGEGQVNKLRINIYCYCLILEGR